MVRLEDFKVGEIKKMISKYNKQVKITTSGLKKADLIKKIREHPRLTVTESEKGVRIIVKSDTTMGGKKIKVKKDEPKEKSEYIKKYEAANAAPKAQLGQSGIGKKRKREEGKPKKKKVIDVEVKENTAKQPEKPKPKPKPKIPTITVTEEEKPKKKVIKRGGRFITVKPKEVKADLPPIPKPKAKIRIAPKKKEEAGPVEPEKINFEKLADEIKDNIIKDPSKVYYKDYANELSKKYKPLKFKLSTSSAVLTSGKDTDFIEIIIKNKKDVVFKKSIGFTANDKDMKKINDFRMERKGTTKLFKKRATPSERETLSNIKGEEEKYQYANKILQKNKSPKKEEAGPAEEEPKEKLIQLDADKAKDRREEMNIKVFNLHNQNFFKHNKPQYKNIQEMEKSAMERRNKEAAEKRARTRAKNQKKKQEETKVETSNKTKEDFIKDFMTSNISDLGFLGNERLTNIKKIINASSDKASKYKYFYTTDFLKVLGYDAAEKLFNKYGVMNTFERIKKMVLKVNPNKKVNIPVKNNVTLRGFPTGLQKKILKALDEEAKK